MNSGRAPVYATGKVQIPPEHIAAVREIRRTHSEERTMAILGIGVATLQKLLAGSRLTPPAADRLAMRLQDLASLK